jgi:hypothetical protein
MHCSVHSNTAWLRHAKSELSKRDIVVYREQAGIGKQLFEQADCLHEAGDLTVDLPASREADLALRLLQSMRFQQLPVCEYFDLRPGAIIRDRSAQIE